MAQLTWRNVDTPNFTPALEGYRTFSNLLGTALSSAEKGLDNFDGALTEKANQAIMQKALQIQDVDEFKQFLAGNVAQNDRATAATMGALQQGLATRGQNATGELQRTQMAADIEWNGKTRGRTERDWVAQDDANPVLAEVDALYAQGKHGAAAELLAANADKLGALSAADRRAALTGGQQIGQGFQGIRQGDLSYRTGTFAQDQAELGVKRSEAANAAITKLGQNSLTWEDFQQNFYNNPDIKSLDATTQRQILDWGVGTYGGSLAMRPGSDAIASAAGSGGPANADGSAGEFGAYDTILGNGQFGAPPKPLTQMTGAEAIAFGRNVLIPATRGNAQLRLKPGEGSSAVGAYQFTQATLADFMPRVFRNEGGINAVLTPQNQERIAEAIFNDSRGSAEALMGRWQSLTRPQAEAIRGKTWAEARDVITRGEVSSSLPTLNRLNAATQTNLARASATDRNQQLLADYGTYANDNSTALAVATRLTSEGGALAGTDRGKVLKAINDQVRNSGPNGRVNPAQAGYLLEVNGRQGSWTDFMSGQGLGGGLGVNGGQLQVDREFLNRSASTDAIDTAQRRAAAQKSLPDLEARANAAKAARDMAAQAIATRGGDRSTLRRYDQAVADATAAYQTALADAQAQGNSGESQQQYDSRQRPSDIYSSMPLPVASAARLLSMFSGR